MATKAQLKSERNKYNGYIETLETYKGKFKEYKSEFNSVAKTDKRILEKSTHWKGKKFEKFEQYADAILTNEGKYAAGYDTQDTYISNRLKKLREEVKSLNYKINHYDDD